MSLFEEIIKLQLSLIVMVTEYTDHNRSRNMEFFTDFSIFHILHLHINCVTNTIFHILPNVIKVGKNYIFQKSLTSLETNWTLLFLSFSLAGPKTKAESSNSQQENENKIKTKSDMFEV